MADKARTLTDRKLSAMENRITQIYTDAESDIQAKWVAYMSEVDSRLSGIQEALKGARITSDTDTIEHLEYEYRRLVQNQTLQDARFRAMVDEVTDKLSNTNQIALSYVNGEMPSIYALNYNQLAGVVDGFGGYSFTLVDETTVKALAVSNKSLLPRKTVDIPKDKLWNTKKINSQVMQGILQGEPISKIATRLEHVTDMNRESAIRNARTMTTSAECKGRQDSYEKATSDGIVMKKVWMASIDDRTRSSHADLNNVEVDVDEVFPNGLMQPGDPSGAPEEVYNCRCSIKAKVIGFKRSDGSISQVKNDKNSNSLSVVENISRERIGRQGSRRDKIRSESDNYTLNKNGEKIVVDMSKAKRRNEFENNANVLLNLAKEYDTYLYKITTGAYKSAGDTSIDGVVRMNDLTLFTWLHEFAHTLTTQSRVKVGLADENEKQFEKELAKLFSGYKDSVHGNPKKGIKGNYKYSISAYSLSDKDEFMAESFAVMISNKNNFDMPSDYYGIDYLYAEKALELINKYFKKKKR